MTHLAICLPNTGSFVTEMAVALLDAAIFHKANGIDQSIFDQQQAGIAASRNKLAERALEAKADYLLWIDSDIVFPRDAVLKLIEHGKDIAGAAYPRRTVPHDMAGCPVRPEEADYGLHEFQFMPFGFMLVKADVYRSIPKPWYFETSSYLGWSRDRLAELLMDNLFADGLRPISKKAALDIADYAMGHEEVAKGAPLTMDCSEDVNFCRKAKRFGFTVWCDMDITRDILHIGKSVVTAGQQEFGVKTIVDDNFGRAKAAE